MASGLFHSLPQDIRKEVQLGVFKMEPKALRHQAPKAFDLGGGWCNNHEMASCAVSACQTSSGNSQPVRKTISTCSSSVPIVSTVSFEALCKSGGSSRIVMIVSRSRTPSTAFTERATCLSPARTVTKRSARSLGEPRTDPKSTTGVGIPRMIDMPCTNDGTPEIGSTGRGRIVSMTCASCRAQTQLLSPTMRAFFVPTVRSIATLFLRTLLPPAKLALPRAESSESTPHSCRLRLQSRHSAQIGLIQTRSQQQAPVQATSLTDGDSGFRWKGGVNQSEAC